MRPKAQASTEPAPISIDDSSFVADGCRVEKSTAILRDVELRAGTDTGHSCYIDSGTRSSGNCVIGDRVTLRYGAIIARGCNIGDGTFVAPYVVFENLNHKRQQVGGAKVGKNCWIGTHSTVAAGVTICDYAIIGAHSYVTKDITRPGVYRGVPARWVRGLKEDEPGGRPLTGDGDGV